MNTYIKAIFLMLLSNNLAFSNPAILIDTINVNKEKNKNQFTKYPQFPGGLDGLAKFITDSLRYPAEFLKDSIQGKVYLSFQVSKQGIVNHDSIFIINSPHNALSLEAVKLIKLMPNWTPGIIYDTITVPVEITLPIPFIYNINTYQEINDTSFYLTEYNNDSNSFIEFENYSLGRIKYEFQEIFYVAEKMPEFPGGLNELVKYMKKNFSYPLIAKQKGIQGKVYVKFVITQNGDVDKAYVIKGLHPLLDQAALDLVNNMPRWHPGLQKGQAVSCWYTMPISYILSYPTLEQSVDVDKYFQSGVKALHKEEWLIAKQYFTRYLGYRPENPDAYNNRAIAYKKLGNMKKACKDWKKALKYNHPEAQKLLDEYCQEYMK